RSTVADNYASSPGFFGAAGQGGGLYAPGGLITYSTFSGNAAAAGAAIATSGSNQLIVKGTTFTANQVTMGGSTIEAYAPASGIAQAVRISNSTLSGNGGSAVVRTRIPTFIYNSTIARNRQVAYYYGNPTTPAGISVTNAALTVTSSIVAEND